jgi:hypothetical protein
MVTTKSKLQMEYNKEVTSLCSAALGLVYVCFGSEFAIDIPNAQKRPRTQTCEK